MIPRINDVATGETPEYPGIQPLRLPAPPEVVFAAVRRVAAEMPGWRRIVVDDATRELRAEAVTRIFRFVDDVTVRVAAEGTGSRVWMRSRSRLGKGDLGANARRIRTFLAALAEAVHEHDR